MGDKTPRKLRKDSQPNFSCIMDPDDLKIFRTKKADVGLKWEEFMHIVTEIIKPIRSVEDLVDLKRLSQREMRKDGKH